MARQNLGTAPAQPLDTATKGYVDALIANVGTGGGGASGGTSVVDNGDGTLILTSTTGGGNLVVGQTNTLTGAGVWVQTDALGNIITFWVENGLAS